MNFIHFGCWNNGKCNMDTGDNGDNGLSKVMKSIKEKIENDPKKFEFITVAGDNYYPEKNKKNKINGTKEKTLIEDNLISGFDCLKSISLHKYVILGNHEFDSIAKKISKGKNNVNDDKPEECVVLKTEKEQVKGDNITFFNDVIEKVDIGTSSIIIMIDTTIYESTNLDDNIGCYRELEFGKDVPNMAKLQEKQKSKVLEILSRNTDKNNIILIGHHPIISTKSKTKDGKTKLQVDYLMGLIEMIYDLVNTLEEGKRIYYLCADTHLYQKGTITFSNNKQIQQYIVGTGGAELDDTNPSKELIIEKDDNISPHIKKYEIEANIKSNGYLECNLSSEGLVANFVKVETGASASANVTGGSRKKTIRYKNKKTKKKNYNTRIKTSTYKKNKSKNKY